MSLDRLPSGSSYLPDADDSEPPCPTSAHDGCQAIRRDADSQSNQCSNRNSTSTTRRTHRLPRGRAAVKVELLQLMLAILDVPVACHVFGDAGFRRSDINLTIPRPALPMPM
jgi:hypothetical protein